MTSLTGIMTSWSLFQNTVILKRPVVAIFADIIKVLTRFTKKISKDSRKVQRIRNYVSKCNLYLYLLIEQIMLISGEKMLMSAELRVCVTWLIYFLDLLWVRYNRDQFHHCRICVADFREGGPFCPHPWPAPKMPILNRVKMGLRQEVWNFIKKGLQHRHFTVNLRKFKEHLPTEHLRWLLLSF